MKVEVEKLHIDKLVNAPSSLNNLRAKLDDLDVEKLKTAPVDFKELSDVVSNEVVKKTKNSKLNLKVNNLENTILDASTLIYMD